MLRALELLIFDEQRAEHEVRLVANREHGFIAALDLPGAVELRERILAPIVLEQRDAEVVRREALEPFGALQPLQDLGRFGVTAEARVRVRAQELDVVDDLVRHSADDAVERVQRVVELAFLEVDAREPIRGVVAHGFVDGALEHGRDRTAGAVMHAIVQLEVADVELRLAKVAVQRIEGWLVDAAMLAELGVEPLERFEIVPLLRVVDRLAEIPVARGGSCSAAGGAAYAAVGRPIKNEMTSD